MHWWKPQKMEKKLLYWQNFAPALMKKIILNIPENWKEISLRVGNTENEDSMKKFYTNVNRVEETKKLALKDEKGYLMDRLLAQKRQADQELEEIQKKITKLLQENEDLSKKEEEIKAKTYLTQAEQKKH